MSKLNNKIDIHTHILPPEIPKFKDTFGYGGFIHLQNCNSCGADMYRDDGSFFRKVEPNCYDPKVRIQECEKFGISKQVLSPVPVMFSYWAKDKDTLYVSKFLNDHLSEVIQDHPDNFYALGTLPMQNTELACQELKRIMESGSFHGVEIGSNINNINLNHPQFFPFYELAQDLNASLFIHPWQMMGMENLDQYWLPWLVGMPAETSRAICSLIFGGVFERFPKLKVAFAHGGGSFPSTIGRIQHGHDVRPDLCAVDNPHSPKNYLGKFWLDTLVHDQDMLSYLVKLIGREKLCLGTDYPFPLGELQPGKLIQESALDTETKDWLNYKSALEWLKN
ncbi:amidohydrolase [Bacteriovoracaceae bacterium]|nr:amidohydrolase [Bacteriovoracaceae bacterium]